MKKVFLGGTCNGSTWREKLIPMLKIDYFDPVVEDWTPACQVIEIENRIKCDLCLYAITPRMSGVYAIAEVVDDSNKRPHKTLFVILEEKDEKFSDAHLKSLIAVSKMISENGGKVFFDLKKVAEYINIF